LRLGYTASENSEFRVTVGPVTNTVDTALALVVIGADHPADLWMLLLARRLKSASKWIGSPRNGLRRF